MPPVRVSRIEDVQQRPKAKVLFEGGALGDEGVPRFVIGASQKYCLSDCGINVTLNSCRNVQWESSFTLDLEIVYQDGEERDSKRAYVKLGRHNIKLTDTEVSSPLMTILF